MNSKIPYLSDLAREVLEQEDAATVVPPARLKALTESFREKLPGFFDPLRQVEIKAANTLGPELARRWADGIFGSLLISIRDPGVPSQISLEHSLSPTQLAPAWQFSLTPASLQVAGATTVQGPGVPRMAVTIDRKDAYQLIVASISDLAQGQEPPLMLVVPQESGREALRVAAVPSARPGSAEYAIKVATGDYVVLFGPPAS